jgi:tetratricopeptide (TPR) repeat protein
MPPEVREVPLNATVTAGHVVVLRQDRAPLDLHPLAVFHECYECYKTDPQRDPRELFIYRGHEGRRIYYDGIQHSLSSQELAQALAERFSQPASGTPRDAIAPAALLAQKTTQWLEKAARDGSYRPGCYVPSKRMLSAVRAHLAQQQHPLLLIAGYPGIGKTALMGYLVSQWQEEGHWILPLDFAGLRTLDAEALINEQLGRPLRELLAAARDQLLAQRRLIIVIDHADRHLDRDLLVGLIQLANSWRREYPQIIWLMTLRDDVLAMLARDPIGARELQSPAIAPTETPGFDEPRVHPALTMPLLDDAERDRLYELARTQPLHRTLSALHQLKQATLEMLRHPALCWIATRAYHEREFRSSARALDVLRRYTRKVIGDEDPQRLELATQLAQTLLSRKRECVTLEELIASGNEHLTNELLSSGPTLAALLQADVLVKADTGTGAFAQRLLRYRYSSVAAYLIAEHLEKLDVTELLDRYRSEQATGLMVQALRIRIQRVIAANGIDWLKQFAAQGAALVQPLLLEVLLAEDAEISARTRAVDNIGPLAEALTGIAEGGRAVLALAEHCYAQGPSSAQGALVRARMYLEKLLDSPLASTLPIDYYLARVLLAIGEPALAEKALKKAARQQPPEPLWDLRLQGAMVEALLALGQPARAEGLARKLFDRLQRASARAELLPCRLLLARAVAACGRAAEARDLFDRAESSAIQANDPAWLRRVQLHLAMFLHSQQQDQEAAKLLRKLADDAARRGALCEHLELLLELAKLAAPDPAAREAWEQLEQAIAAAETLGPSLLLAHARMGLGCYCTRCDQLEKACEQFLRAIRLAEQFADQQLVARAHAELGLALQERGENQVALDHVSQALELFKRLGERRGLGRIYRSIAAIFRDHGDRDKALEYLARAIDISQQNHDDHEAAHALCDSAELQAACGSHDRARELLARARKLFEHSADQSGLGRCWLAEGRIARHQDQLEDAGQALLRALDLLTASQHRHDLAAAQVELALLERQQGHSGRALQLYQQAAALCEARGDKRSLAQAYNGIGVIYEEQGDTEQARIWFERDLAITEKLGDLAGIALSHTNLAILHYNQRNYVKALYSLEKARDAQRRRGDAVAVSDIEGKIARVKAKM